MAELVFSTVPFAVLYASATRALESQASESEIASPAGCEVRAFWHLGELPQAPLLMETVADSIRLLFKLMGGFEERPEVVDLKVMLKDMHMAYLNVLLAVWPRQ